MTHDTTLTALLRRKLAEADSIYAVSKAADVEKASLIRFARGDQGLNLDSADKLCRHFGIVHREVASKKPAARTTRRKGGK